MNRKKSELERKQERERERNESLSSRSEVGIEVTSNYTNIMFERISSLFSVGNFITASFFLVCHISSFTFSLSLSLPLFPSLSFSHFLLISKFSKGYLSLHPLQVTILVLTPYISSPPFPRFGSLPLSEWMTGTRRKELRPFPRREEIWREKQGSMSFDDPREK